MQNVLQKKQVAAEVAGALAPEVRELTVTITVKARVADDSPLAPLVAEALQELIKREPDTEAGEFESKAGLDVSWKVTNEYVSNLRGH
jgi:hypothetical protein